MEIYAVKASSIASLSSLKKVACYMDKERMGLYGKIRKVNDIKLGMCSEILVKTILSRKLKVPVSEVNITLNDYGKPYLEFRKNIHFNVSHSGEWVVLALDGYPIGIDIELVKPVDYSIVETFFASEERLIFRSKCNREKLSYFYDLWTLKESYIKAEGAGLSISLDSFAIAKDEESITMIRSNSSTKYYFKQYFVDYNHILSVCAQRFLFAECICIIQYQNLIDEFLSRI